MTEILWIKDPLAIMPDGAGRGVLVQGRWTVIDGTLPDLDPDALRHHHQDAARALQSS